MDFPLPPLRLPLMTQTFLSLHSSYQEEKAVQGGASCREERAVQGRSIRSAEGRIGGGAYNVVGDSLRQNKQNI